MASAVTAIEIISLEENLRLMKLRIRCTNGESNYFRCKLDPFTYKNLAKIVIPELLAKKIEGINVSPANKSIREGARKLSFGKHMDKRSYFHSGAPHNFSCY